MLRKQHSFIINISYSGVFMIYRFVRGVRVIQQLNEVSTVDNFQDNIERGFPNTRKRQHATGDVTIQTVEFIPYIGTKMLHVKSTCSSTSGNRYNQVIQFTRVNFEPDDTDTNATFKATNGQDYHVQPINLADHNVKVRCNCMDFYWRFASYDAADRSLVGKGPAPYVRKTDNRPPANPMHVPGFCKHLIKLTQHLQGIGLAAA